MSNTTRTFDYQDDKSSKFWEIIQTDDTVTVRYGKTGTQGQTQDKTFTDASALAKHVAKLIADKTAKGYVERGSVQPVQAASVDEPEVTADPADGGTPPSAEPQTKKTSTKTSQTSAKAVKPAKAAKPKNPAQNPEATPDSLLALLDKDDATNRLLARHPRASAELLEKLSHSSDMAARKAVCLNPNASKEVLIRLAPQFPGDFFLNPAFDWLLLEEPDLLFKLGKGVLKNILKRSDCPLSFIQWAAKHGNEQEQLALAMNPSTPQDIIKTLAQRKGTLGDAARGRTMVSGAEQSVPQEVLDATFISEVKKALSEVKPSEVVSAWKRDMVTSAHKPWLNLDCRLLLDDISLSLVVIGAMKDRESELAAHSNPEVRAWVARFLEGDARLLETLAGDSNIKVRAAVAGNLV